MQSLEELHAIADLYIWLSKRSPNFPDLKKAMKCQSGCCALINVCVWKFFYYEINCYFAGKFGIFLFPSCQKKSPQTRKRKGFTQNPTRTTDEQIRFTKMVIIYSNISFQNGYLEIKFLKRLRENVSFVLLIHLCSL